MPVRFQLVTDPAARVLFDSIVDYAGLYPPAAVSMSEAVRNYARYRGGSAGWMLGRFVCPVAEFDSFADVAEPLLPRDAGAIPWRLSGIGTGAHARDAEAVANINERHRWSWDQCNAVVDTVETRAASLAEVEELHAAFAPDTLVYVELTGSTPLRESVAALASHGRRAKMRTGGVVAEAFPKAEAIGAFMRECISQRVPFKLTAGLHHLVTGRYRFTYEDGSDVGRMFGFLNTFLAAALIGMDAPKDAVIALLEEEDATSFVFRDQGIAWRDYTVDRTTLAYCREHMALSFGSCSFLEPTDESRAAEAW